MKGVFWGPSQRVLWGVMIMAFVAVVASCDGRSYEHNDLHYAHQPSSHSNFPYFFWAEAARSSVCASHLCVTDLEPKVAAQLMELQEYAERLHIQLAMHGIPHPHLYVVQEKQDMPQVYGTAQMYHLLTEKIFTHKKDTTTGRGLVLYPDHTRILAPEDEQSQSDQTAEVMAMDGQLLQDLTVWLEAHVSSCHFECLPQQNTILVDCPSWSVQSLSVRRVLNAVFLSADVFQLSPEKRYILLTERLVQYYSAFEAFLSKQDLFPGHENAVISESGARKGGVVETTQYLLSQEEYRNALHSPYFMRRKDRGILEPEIFYFLSFLETHQKSKVLSLQSTANDLWFSQRLFIHSDLAKKYFYRMKSYSVFEEYRRTFYRIMEQQGSFPFEINLSPHEILSMVAALYESLPESYIVDFEKDILFYYELYTPVFHLSDDQFQVYKSRKYDVNKEGYHLTAATMETIRYWMEMFYLSEEFETEDQGLSFAAMLRIFSDVMAMDKSHSLSQYQDLIDNRYYVYTQTLKKDEMMQYYLLSAGIEELYPHLYVDDLLRRIHDAGKRERCQEWVKSTTNLGPSDPAIKVSVVTDDALCLRAWNVAKEILRHGE